MKVQIILFLILLVSVTACQVEIKQPPTYKPDEKETKIENNEEYLATAKKASDNFHSLYNNEKFQDLFDLIDEKSQLKSDQIFWDRRMNNIKNDLGKFENAQFTRGNAFQKSQTVEVRIEYISKFEKESGAKPRYELFYWEIYPNGDVKLLEYKNGIDYEKGY